MSGMQAYRVLAKKQPARESIRSPKTVVIDTSMYGKNARKQSYQNARLPSTTVVAGPAGFLRNRNTTGVRVEKKVIDLVNASYAVEDTGTQLALLNGCIPGSNNANRIGRKVNLKSLQVQGFIIPADLTVNAGKFRMVIVYDKQSNGAAPTWANIMTSQSAAAVPVLDSAYNAMVNLDNRDRFEIIRDYKVDYAGINTTASQTYASSPLCQVVDMYIKLGNRETVYNAGTAGTIGDITSGALYVFFIASQPNASGVTFNGSFRVRFTDQ